jgi:hypothetical protein
MSVTTTFQGTTLLGTGSTSIPASEGLVTQAANASTSPLLGSDLTATGGSLIGGTATLTNLSTTDGTTARASSPSTNTTNSSTTTTPNPTLATSGIKQTVTTSLIPNPLHQYASYNYAWSLWILSVEDTNNLFSVRDYSQSSNWTPTKNKSFVLAEDSGLFPDWRVPGYGLNYNIQSVDFDTVLAHDQSIKSSNVITGHVKIVEPLGFSFLDSLSAAVPYPGNFTKQCYLLQLDFFGYDDAGNLISSKDATLLRKRFPVHIVTCKSEIGTQGAEYNLTISAAGQTVHNNDFGKTPKQITVTAGTVGEFFKNFQTQLNNFYMVDSVDAKNSVYWDQYQFLVDPTFDQSPINFGAVIPLSQSNPAATGIDLSKNNINIAAGTEILSVIDRILAQSNYLTQNQLNLGVTPDTIASATNSAASAVNIIKVQGGIQYGGGYGTSTTPVYGVIDPQRNVYPLICTIAIHQYQSNKGQSPNAGVVPDTRALQIKQYNYIYTGQNIDVTEFKLKFDLAYYNAVLGYTNAIGATQATQTTGADSQLQYAGSVKIVPSWLTATIPGLSSVQNPTPAAYRFIVNDQQITHGAGVQNNSFAQKGMDTLKSIYNNPSTGDMAVIEATIVGDPVFLKQDDWLYVQDPTNTSSMYNQWDTVSQSDFFAKTGHIRTDVGDIIVQFNIFTPLDYDVDILNNPQGLMYPAAGTKSSTFSGQYRIYKIKHKFEKGIFTQVLTLCRYINSSLIGATSQGAVAQGNANNRASVGSNG